MSSSMKSLLVKSWSQYPADILRRNNVIVTSMRRHNIEITSIRHSTLGKHLLQGKLKLYGAKIFPQCTGDIIVMNLLLGG